MFPGLLTAAALASVIPGMVRALKYSSGSRDASAKRATRKSSSNPGAPAGQIEAESFAKGRPSSILQRMIEPGEIANLVAYLASPLSSATNGAALRGDGGVVPSIS
jgi:NAD(P)-dependent dehydrogenase (short-subunit alcohol dehydrogenase family)